MILCACRNFPRDNSNYLGNNLNYLRDSFSDMRDISTNMSTSYADSAFDEK